MGWDAALVVTAAPLDFAVTESDADLTPDSGFCALALAVLPYTSRALLVIFMIRLMSWYDARNTIGFAPTSMLVNCWEIVERLSKENVKSILSKNRAESAILFMRVSDIPRSSMVKARIPCTKNQYILGQKDEWRCEFTCWERSSCLTYNRIARESTLVSSSRMLTTTSCRSNRNPIPPPCSGVSDA